MRVFKITELELRRLCHAASSAGALLSYTPPMENFMPPAIVDGLIELGAITVLEDTTEKVGH